MEVTQSLEKIDVLQDHLPLPSLGSTSVKTTEIAYAICVLAIGILFFATAV